MTLDLACDASPFRIAVNLTGFEPTLARRHRDGTWDAFRQLSNGEWVHAPSNHAAAMRVHRSAWVPVMKRARLPRLASRRIA